MNSRYQSVKISENNMGKFDENYSILDTETGLYILDIPNQWVGGEYVWASLETVIAERAQWNGQQAEMIASDLNNGSIETMRERAKETGKEYEIVAEGHDVVTLKFAGAVLAARRWANGQPVEEHRTVKWLGGFKDAIMVNGEIFAIEK